MALVAWAAWLDITVRSQFEGRRWQVPARIYARPLELYPGAPVTASDVETELRALGYRDGGALQRPGSFRRSGDTLEVRTRRFRFWDGEEPERRMRVRFGPGGVRGIAEGAREVAIARLEPQLIARIDPRHREDRVLVRAAEVPKALVGALLAVEDRGFFDHSGVSLRGIARALLANLRAGETVQGGSTITQQLAKSYFLSAERTVWRKLNDIAIAMLLEQRYSKMDILDAYLNEVYLGQDGRRAIHGFGLGAMFYFGRPVEELDLAESALLVGLVRGPSYYNPRRHPERALERRALVLERMRETGLISQAQADAARGAALGVTPRPLARDGRYGAFVDLVRRQLAIDYAAEDLQSDGLRIFTTLDPALQRAAERAVERRLAEIERARALTPGSLEVAVVVVEPQSGEVSALVGARDGRAGGFNRALDARRQVGSVLKPVVYLSALASGQHSLLSVLDDSPLTVTDAAGRSWSPMNYDGRFRGPVTLLEALAQSLNVPTVRLGLSLGVEPVAALLARLGLERPVKPYPSMFLGAVEMAPVEVAQIYQAIAAGGFRHRLRAIRDVTTAEGQPLARYGMEVEEAAPPAAVFVLQHALGEVMRSGTARSAAHRLPGAEHLAGKTGTTDDLRDSWFAGFGANRLTVVWIGRDDNGEAGLTGATGALRVWTDVMSDRAVMPLSQQAPATVAWFGVDLEAGLRFDVACGVERRLPFVGQTGPPPARCDERATMPVVQAAPQARSRRLERRREEAQ